MTRFLSCVLVAVAMACGADDGSLPDGDWVPDDIDEQQTLDRLGAAGYAKVCSAFEGYIRDKYRSNRMIQLACIANALETTADATACGESADACLDELPPAVEAQLQSILAQASCSTVGITTMGCSSPVSALTGCLDALDAQLGTIQLSATCAAFGSPVPDDWWRIEPPAACTSLGASC